MKIFITGASGYIGSNLTSHLADRNHEIAVLLRKHADMDQPPGKLNRCHVYRTDGELEGLVEALGEFRPEVVVHLASLFLSQHRADQVKDLIAGNILFSALLVEAMAATGVDKLINTGTSWQHFKNDAFNPVNLYAATKQAFEDICDYYTQALEFKIITLKLFETYGPGDPRKKIIPLLLKSLGKGETIKLSPGEQKLDLVHIGDICSAYEQAILEMSHMQQPGHCRYGVSSDRRIRLRDLVDLIENISGKTLPVVWGGRPYRDREVFEPWSNFDPVPGWKPKISIKEGLRALIHKALY